MQWVEVNLASEIAQKAKLCLVIGHLSLHSVAEEKSTLVGNYINDVDSLRNLLEKYKVYTSVEINMLIIQPIKGI